MLKYDIQTVTNGINGYSLRFCTDCYNAILVANVETTIVVPNQTSVGMYGNINNKLLAQFSYQGTLDFPVVWVNLNATSVIPVNGILTFAERNVLNPNARMVQGGDVIHMICAQNTVNVCIEFFSLQ